MASANKNGWIFLALGALLLLLLHPIADISRSDIDPLKGATAFAKALDEKSNKALRAIEFIRIETRRYGPERAMYAQSDYLANLFREHGIALFIYQNDELVLWSNHSISPLTARRAAAEGREIVHLQNGWYRLLYLTDGIEEYIAAICIRHTFPYQNSYLTNHFLPGFNIRGLTDIGIKPHQSAVKLRANHQFFYLSFSAFDEAQRLNPQVYIFVAIAGGLLVFLGLLFLFSRAGPAIFGNHSFPLFALLTVALRAWSIRAGWPGYVLDIDWFSPSVYASSLWFPSLSDFIFNAMLLGLLAFCGRYVFVPQAPAGSRYASAQFSLLLLLLLAYAAFANYLIKGLVLNSNIPFDINVVTQLNAFSITSLCTSGLLYFSFFLLADCALVSARNNGLSPSTAILWLLGLGFAYITVAHLLGMRDMVFVLWPIAVLGLLIYLRLYTPKGRMKLTHTISVIVLFAAVASHNFIKYAQVREGNQRNVLVEKLALNDDPIAELLFAELHPQLVRDRNVQRVFEEGELHTRQLMEGYIIQRYFTGYWGNYDIEIYPFHADSTAWGKMSPVRPQSFREFLRRASRYGDSTSADSTLHYLYASRELTSYIAILPLHYNLAREPDGFFIILFSSKLFGQQSGFPSLLVDTKTGSAMRKAERYATAKYVNGRLRSSSGDYVYRTDASIFTSLEKYPAMVSKSGFEHLVSRTDDDTIVVVSKPEVVFLDKATVFSYLCALFALLFIMGKSVRDRISGKGTSELNLNQKIQALLITLTLVSMVIFAWATMFYIETNYTQKNKGLVREKMQSILREVQDQLNEEEELSLQMSDHVTRLLSELSFIFYTDIHLYSPDGDLLASSQMRMFNEGLVSRQMHPAAFAQLAVGHRTSFLHEEYIGAMRYISAYTPLYNRHGDLLGYLNLPYFARQAELEQEIGSFLETVINIFVLLFIVSIFIGLFISQWITSPLRAIRASLAEVELGKANRILGYSSQDEIGLLVAEYNAKVSELEHNAEKFAQSERESAWREMAKQVAHEIKNPLTPMKLSIQHLQHILERGDTVSQEQAGRITDNLIEQINALTAIANAFSNFARMPGTSLAPVNLADVLSKATSLFSNFDNVSLQLTLQHEAPAMVLSDKDQMIRVFNNLIKNALQAIPKEQKGVIAVVLSAKEGGYQVMVQDNGTGVSDDVKNKIFEPNFTTKSRGMGLGLAMCKNMVENSKGRIWFESLPGEGSRFYVWLPAI